MGFLGVRAGSLKNKTVVITGASVGLGATLARECAQRGARLVILARNAERLEAVARECEQLGGEVLTVVGDVAVAEDGKRLVEAAIERFGGIDYLVANAGIGDQVVYAPKPLDRSLHQPPTILGYSDIPDDSQHLAPQLLALSGNGLQPLGIPR